MADDGRQLLERTTMQTSYEIDYDDLAQSYLVALNDTLRLFRPGPGFLQTWVLDEDVATSIAGIVAAAEESGVERLRIRVSPALAGTLERARLETLTQGLAQLAFSDDAQGLVLDAVIASGQGVARATRASKSVAPAARPSRPPTAARGVTSAPTELGPSYAQGIASVLAALSHEHPIAAQGDELLLEANAGAVTLQIAVDPASHLVRRAGHRGATTDEHKALFEALCVAMEGRTVQDNADHAALRAEQMLRGRTGERPVRGIVMPENASQAFGFAIELARALRADYRARTGFAETRNTFDAPPTERWRAASNDERLSTLAELTRQWCKASGLAEDAVYPIEVVDAYRTIFEVTMGPDRKRAQLGLIALEAHLKDRIEPMLELCLEEMKDRNKMRKLEIRTSKNRPKEVQ